MPTESAQLLFDVPGGCLTFADGDLDVWAEHLTWCYRMMGIADGATIAVQDFGTSPVSFLGSALLMPGLRRGVAERLGGRFICLDASAERVTLTPALLEQLAVDALVIRDDVIELMAAELRKKGFAGLAERAMKTIVVFGDEPPTSNPVRGQQWRHLMHIESALLLAPECAQCGCLHLRHEYYDVDGGRVRNLRLDVPGYDLPASERLLEAHCSAGPRDWRITLPARRGGI